MGWTLFWSYRNTSMECIRINIQFVETVLRNDFKGVTRREEAKLMPDLDCYC